MKRVSKKFTLIEPKIRGYTPDKPFGLVDSGAPIFDIFRLLKGTTNLRDNETKKIITLNVNETRIGPDRAANPEHIFSYLIDSNDDRGIGFIDFKKFIEESRLINKEFFECLRDELVLCIMSKSKGRYTESFLYFYRILEYIALAFPLTYSLIENDFKKAHEFLKSLLTEKNSGDLSAMNTFIPKIAKSGGFESECFDFSFEGYEMSRAQSCTEEINKCLANQLKNIVFHDEYSPYNFSVPFNSMHSFVALIRNRLFHNRVGEKNFNLSRVGGSEILADIVMREALHWFSKIYSEIIRSLLHRTI